MATTKKELEQKVAELESRLELAGAGDYVQGVRASVKAIETVRENSRGEYAGIIDRCLNAVSELTADVPQPIDPSDDEPDDSAGGDQGDETDDETGREGGEE